MLPIRNLNLVGIIRARLVSPSGRDLGKHRTPVLLKLRVGDGERNVGVLAVKETRVGRVQKDGVESRGVPVSDLVTRLATNKREDVGAHVPPAQGVEIPVGFDGGDLGIVVVEAAVSCACQGGGHCVTDQNGQDTVLSRVGVVLVEGDENERVVHEIPVVQ